MGKIKVSPKYQNIADMFGSLTGSQSMHDVFCDWVTMTACAIQNSCCIGQLYDKHEKNYLDIAKKYSREELDKFAEITAEIMMMLEKKPFQDLLGDLYMQLGIASSENGQFFTPYSVAQMMAHCTSLDSVIEEIAEQGYAKIYEPACGGGATIIAFLEYLQEKNINYQNKLVCVCQDLNRVTALMCYIVLSLLGAMAVIKVGDTLSKPYTKFMDEQKKGSDIWYTPFLLINGRMGAV